MGNINNKTEVLFPKKSSELAEFVGIMLGDGNINITKLKSKPNSYNHSVRIIGHKKDDKEYLLNYIASLTKKLFGIKFRAYRPKEGNTLLLKNGCKDIVKILNYYGLKDGNKMKNKTKIPEWVFESKKYLKTCIRGLIDTDGCVCPITGRNYSYIWFKTSNLGLKDTFSKAMEILDFRIAKWYKDEKMTIYGKGTSYQTYIGSKKHISKYYKEIGFSNKKHIMRFKAPVV